MRCPNITHSSNILLNGAAMNCLSIAQSSNILRMDMSDPRITHSWNILLIGVGMIYPSITRNGADMSYPSIMRSTGIPLNGSNIMRNSNILLHCRVEIAV